MLAPATTIRNGEQAHVSCFADHFPYNLYTEPLRFSLQVTLVLLTAFLGHCVLHGFFFHFSFHLFQGLNFLQQISAACLLCRGVCVFLNYALLETFGPEKLIGSLQESRLTLSLDVFSQQGFNYVWYMILSCLLLRGSTTHVTCHLSRRMLTDHIGTHMPV